MAEIEYQAIFKGRVQGVGFRWTARSFALESGLAGSVKNLPDGTVELIVQGPQEKIGQLIKRLLAHFQLSQDDVQGHYQEALQLFNGFQILR